MENMNNEIELIENKQDENQGVDNYEVTYEEPRERKSNGGLIALGVGLVCAAAAGVYALTKDKIEAGKNERAKARLVKQGYVVVEPETNSEEDYEVVEGEVIDTEETNE